MKNATESLNNKREIVLLNDSFPPLIDGVINTVTNYSRVLRTLDWDISVVTPDYPGADDSGFDYPVIRYPSIDLRKYTGYTAGNPFSLNVQKELRRHNVALIHSHCPVMSNMVARELRSGLNAPLVMTYHTKFDVDIANIIKIEAVRKVAARALVESVSSVDELWVVSDGAGKNIQSLGYEGDYIVMPNGVDMPRQKATMEDIQAACGSYDLPYDVPLFLFVGRLMWYKGIKIILDALAALRSQDIDFRMVFIGGGKEEDEIKAYASALNLGPQVLFIGPVRDRAALAAWYTRADLFLFPSTFDTNGLVVREAAACGLASVLIGGSCAAEGVTNRVDGLLIEENAASLAVCLASVMNRKDTMKQIGDNASANLYRSWDTAVAEASERYEIVIDNWKSGKYNRKKNLTDGIFEIQGDILDAMESLKSLLPDFRETRNQ